MSLVDDLTGLYNRRAFLALAEQQLRMAARMKKKMVLFFGDIDGFKRINDDFGHIEGDRALAETAQILRETFRQSDIVARIGGDEFVVLASNGFSENAESLSQRLIEGIDRRNSEGKISYKLSLSLGVIHYNPKSPCTIDELLRRADASMYENKRGKRNADSRSMIFDT